MNASSGGDTEWISASTAPGDGGRVEMRRRPDGGVDVRDCERPETVVWTTPILEYDPALAGQDYDVLARLRVGTQGTFLTGRRVQGEPVGDAPP